MNADTNLSTSRAVDRLLDLSDAARDAGRLESASVLLDMADRILDFPEPCWDPDGHLWRKPWQWQSRGAWVMTCDTCAETVTGDGQ